MNWTNKVGKFSLFFIVLLCTIVIEWAISNQFDFPFHTHQNKKFIVSHDWKSIQFIFVHFIWHYFHFPAASEWEIIGTFFKKKYTHRHVWTYWTIHPPVYFINKKKPSLLCCFYEKKAALYCPIKKKRVKCAHCTHCSYTCYKTGQLNALNINTLVPILSLISLSTVPF